MSNKSNNFSRSSKRLLALLCIGLGFFSTLSQSNEVQAMRTEPVGGQPPLESKVSVENLEEQVAYQRAFEATIWAMPALGIYGLRQGFMNALGMNDNDIAAFSGPLKQTMEAITPNTVTPYIVAFSDLRNGPVVLEIPAKTEKSSLYGQVVDYWQITIADVGPAGMDKGKGGKYLFLPPGYDTEVPEGYIPVQSTGNRIGFAFRSVRGSGASNDDAYAYTKLLKMYPLSEAASPPEQRFVDGLDIVVPTLPDYSIKALEDIKAIMDIEPVLPRDRAMMGMLASLGIAKGIPFDPAPEMKEAMERGVRDAYFYMQHLVDKMHAANLYWDNRHWSLVMQPDAKRGFAFETDDALQVDARAAAWHFFTFYPAVMSEKVGTVYLAPIADSSGQTVEAGKNYRLSIPADTPAKQFWSLTMYDHATWSFIINPLGRSGLSSLDKDKLQVNDDGSVDIYFGPDEPKGYQSNWLPTEGKRPYVWLRLYGPDTRFWDKSFTMPDVELLK